MLAADFPVGAAIALPQTLGERARLLTKHFSQVTPGNALKWDATEPTEGAFRYTDADALVAFAKANDLRVRGHTLVWHQQTPAWVFNDADGQPMTATAANKTLLLTRLENHIRAVAARYANDIYAWDVVNEVIDENQADGLRRSTWFTITGLDYIRTAFRVARAGRAATRSCTSTTTTPTCRPSGTSCSPWSSSCGPRACRSTASATRCTATWTGRPAPTPTR